MSVTHKHNWSSNKDEEQCEPQKSKLFCTSDNGLLSAGFNFPIDQWQTLATLKVCEEECSDVLHDVCGIVSTVTVGPSINIIQKFRIIDEVGREVCQHTFNFFEDVSSATAITVDFPFKFKCCDEPRHCKCNTTYRLQTATGGIPENRRVMARDVTWAAIVWESR